MNATATETSTWTPETPWDMSDATAQAACDYEDGDLDAVAAFLATASPAEKTALVEEIEIIDRKRARAAAYTVRPTGDGTLAARNAARAIRSGADAYEAAILSRQERVDA